MEYSTALNPRRVDAFWSQVDKTGECWLWQGRVGWDGYGRFFAFGNQRLAHRIAYLLAHSNLPSDLCVCHKCDTPRCCNPAHLFLGTVAENNADMRAKKRHFVPAPTGTNRKRPAGGKPPVRYGEQNGQAKLADSQVVELRELRRQGKKLRELAQIFDISMSHAGNICTGRCR